MVAVMGCPGVHCAQEHREEVAREPLRKAKRGTRNVDYAMFGMADGPTGGPTPDQGARRASSLTDVS
jgi:hypothetical protein